MAAGKGTRMRPLSEQWPKPILPIDGRPVVVVLVRELLELCSRVVVVTGHLAEQVEALVEPFGVECVRQPPGQGSADAVHRARPRPPYLVLAADTLYEPGAVARFAAEAAGSDGAVACAGEERAPLWYAGARVHEHLDPLPGTAPYELADVFALAGAAGASVSAIPVGRTRDLTSPVDVMRQNFPYLR